MGGRFKWIELDIFVGAAYCHVIITSFHNSWNTCARAYVSIAMAAGAGWGDTGFTGRVGSC